MATATKTPAHLTPTSSGAKPAGLTKVTASQWQSLLHLSATGQLSGVPPAVIAAVQQAEAPALGSTWSINSSGYGGGFGVGVGTVPGTVPVETDLKDQSGAGYDAQAIAAAHVFSDGLIANNGDVQAAEFFYQNGNRTPGVPYLSNGKMVLPTTEGVKVFQAIQGVPGIISSHFGNGTGKSTLATKLENYILGNPQAFYGIVPGTPSNPNPSQGAAVPGLDVPLLETPAVAAADKAQAAADTGAIPTTAASSGGLLGSIETGVHDDLMVAGYLLGGAAALILGAVLAFKQQSGSEEIGWLLLWLGGTVLWATLTKRSPICVFKSVVSGTNTTGCVGTISGGNLFAGTLTALGAVFAGSAALNALKGTSGGGGGGGGGGNEKTSAEDTAGSEGSTVAEDVGSAAEDFAP